MNKSLALCFQSVGLEACDHSFLWKFDWLSVVCLLEEIVNLLDFFCLFCFLPAPSHQPAPCHATTDIFHPSGLFGRKTEYASGWLISHSARAEGFFFFVSETSFTEQSRNSSQFCSMIHISCQWPVQRPFLNLVSSCPASLLLYAYNSGMPFLLHHPDLSLHHVMILSWVWWLPAWPSKAPVQAYHGSQSQLWWTAPLPSLSAMLADHLQSVQLISACQMQMSLLSHSIKTWYALATFVQFNFWCY